MNGWGIREPAERNPRRLFYPLSCRIFCGRKEDKKAPGRIALRMFCPPVRTSVIQNLPVRVIYVRKGGNYHGQKNPEGIGFSLYLREYRLKKGTAGYKMEAKILDVKAILMHNEIRMATRQ